MLSLNKSNQATISYICIASYVRSYVYIKLIITCVILSRKIATIQAANVNTEGNRASSCTGRMKRSHKNTCKTGRSTAVSHHCSYCNCQYQHSLKTKSLKQCKMILLCFIANCVCISYLAN